MGWVSMRYLYRFSRVDDCRNGLSLHPTRRERGNRSNAEAIGGGGKWNVRLEYMGYLAVVT